MTSDDAAASACARKGSGRAWTSLRSAAFTAGVDSRGRAGDQEQGAGLTGGQPGQVGAGAAHEAPAAASALHGVHGHAGHAQGVEVAAGGALGDLQLPGDLRCGHLLALLQQEEDGHQPVGSHPDNTATGNRSGGDRFRSAGWRHDHSIFPSPPSFRSTVWNSKSSKPAGSNAGNAHRAVPRLAGARLLLAPSGARPRRGGLPRHRPEPAGLRQLVPSGRRDGLRHRTPVG